MKSSAYIVFKDKLNVSMVFARYIIVVAQIFIESTATEQGKQAGSQNFDSMTSDV